MGKNSLLKMPLQKAWLPASVACALTLSSCNRAPAPSTEDGFNRQADLSSQIQRDILSSIRKNRSAKTFAEWKSSGYTPADLFKNARALKMAETETALCAGLEKLPSKDLALYENEVFSPLSKKTLPCSSKLAARIQAFWKEGEAALEKIRKISLPRAQAGRRSVAGQEEGTDGREIPFERSGPLPKPGPRQIVLVFDSSLHADRTPRVLKALKSAEVRAHFFIAGSRANEMSELTREIGTAGHVIGSAAWMGSNLARQDLRVSEKQIDSARETLTSIIGVQPSLFYFPYGASTPELRSLVKERGMSVLDPSLDTQDWKHTDLPELYHSLLNSVEAARGGTIVFHDDLEQTALVLPYFLAEAKARGFTTLVYVAR